MNADLRDLYSWVQAARERVFAWAESLPAEIYTQERPDFAYGSLRNVQAHIADCYFAWIGVRGLGLPLGSERLDTSAAVDVAAMRRVYNEVDGVLEQAFTQFTQPDGFLDVQFHDEALRVTQRWLVMHPITHEFHHKGQMLTMGRILGWPYPPGPDTDLGLPTESGIG